MKDVIPEAEKVIRGADSARAVALVKLGSVAVRNRPQITFLANDEPLRVQS